MSRLPNQRWLIASPDPDLANRLAQITHLPPLLTQVLINRGIDTPDAAQTFLDPEQQALPSPLEEFPDLPIALEILLRAIDTRQAIAICGDYDADGMTSTALLLRALRYMGAIVDYAIPSRMQEGYGINCRIIEEFYEDGISLVLTVDNGIAAHEPIARARELGLTVIVTDHHDLPETLPDANAILNPKLIDEASPYRGIAGVGVAYVLAVCLAQCMQKTQDLTTSLIELFTLGTIADLAPLTGVNRRWVRRGLKLLPRSRIPGIQALIQVAGLSNEKQLKPEAIGFRLGPRINAIGRLADPQIVIDLLTTEDDGYALELAMKCEQVNQLRQRLCELIEQEAIEWCEQNHFDPQEERVLLVVQPEWHHGVIGIVASRLVERYGVPVFIGTYEEEDQTRIRGSARGIAEFNVFEALQFCGDVLSKYGGHRAAGGFSLNAENLGEFRSRLKLFAHGQLRPEHLKPLVTIDAQANLADLTQELYDQIDALHPCGIENPDPVFWTPNVRVVEQQTIGRDQTHLKVTLVQEGGAKHQTSAFQLPITDYSLPITDYQLPNTQLFQPQPFNTPIKAIAWRWGEYYPLPRSLDIAYRLRLNEWNGSKNVELELVGVRPASPKQSSAEFAEVGVAVAKGNVPVTEKALEPVAVPIPVKPSPPVARVKETNGLSINQVSTVIGSTETKSTEAKSTEAKLTEIKSAETDADVIPYLQTETETESDLETDRTLPRIEFYYNKRSYTCNVVQTDHERELRIRNGDGQVLTVQPNQRYGRLGKRRSNAEAIDLSHPHYFNLIRAALSALEQAKQAQILQHKDEVIAQKDQLIAEKDQVIAALTQQLSLLQRQSPTEQPHPQAVTSLTTEIQARQAAIAQRDTQVAQLQQETLQLTSDSIPVPPKPDAGKRQVRRRVGDAVWKRLNPHSQRDLSAAMQHYLTLQAEEFTAQLIDYSEAGLRLGSAVEREVIQPFFKQIHQFLLNSGAASEIGGIPLRVRKKYSLNMLPPLLAIEWTAFQPDLLECDHPVDEAELQCAAGCDSISWQDREIIQAFLNQWQHPIARWLVTQGDSAASTLDQISQLRHRAAEPDCLLLEWQFQILAARVIGNDRCKGIFQAIYGEQ